MYKNGGTRLILAATLALAVGACAGGSGPRSQGGGADAAALPAAERLDADLVMVPVARDGRGCVQYRLQSDRRPRLEALFYRTRAGDFSTIEAEAACS